MKEQDNIFSSLTQKQTIDLIVFVHVSLNSTKFSPKGKSFTPCGCSNCCANRLEIIFSDLLHSVDDSLINILA